MKAAAPSARRPTLVELRLVAAGMREAISKASAKTMAADFSDKDVEAFYAAALLLLKQGDLPRADTVLVQVCDLRPAETRYLHTLARVRQAKGEYESAINLFRYLDLLDPGNPMAALEVSECWLALGARDKAIVVIDAVIRHCDEEGIEGEVADRAKAMAKFLKQ